MKKLALILSIIAIAGCDELEYGSMDHICALNAQGNLPEHLIPIYGDEAIVLSTPKEMNALEAAALYKLDGIRDAKLQRALFDYLDYLPRVKEFYDSNPTLKDDNGN